MKTKERVKKWITNHKSLRDNDNALCVYIWAEEMEELGLGNINVPTIEFFKNYSYERLTNATSIVRMRRKLQEQYVNLRGQKYKDRKIRIQDNWKKHLGYEVN